MEQAKLKRKKGAFGAILLILLSPVILAALYLVVILIYAAVAKLPYDNPDTLILETPMSASERFEIDAENRTLTVAADKADVWWVLRNTDAGTLLSGAEDALSRYGVKLLGAGLTFEPDEITVHLKIGYGGTLKIPLKAKIRPVLDQTSLTVTVTEVYLGPALKLPLDYILQQAALDAETLTLRIDRSEYPELDGVTAFSVAQDRLLLTSTLDAELFKEAAEDYRTAREVHYCYETGAIPAADAVIDAYDGGDPAYLGETFARVLAACEENPETLGLFRRDVLALAHETATSHYFSDVKGQLMERFLPAASEAEVAARSEEFDAALLRYKTVLKALLDSAQSLYNGGKLALSRSRFVMKDSPETDLSLAILTEDMDGAWREVLDEAAFRVVFVEGQVGTFGVPLMRDVPKNGNGEINTMRPNRSYPVALLLRMRDGTPMLAYADSLNAFVLTEIPEERAAAMFDDPFIPTYTVE